MCCSRRIGVHPSRAVREPKPRVSSGRRNQDFSADLFDLAFGQGAGGGTGDDLSGRLLTPPPGMGKGTPSIPTPPTSPGNPGGDRRQQHAEYPVASHDDDRFSANLDRRRAVARLETAGVLDLDVFRGALGRRPAEDSWRDGHGRPAIVENIREMSQSRKLRRVVFLGWSWGIWCEPLPGSGLTYFRRSLYLA